MYQKKTKKNRKKVGQRYCPRRGGGGGKEKKKKKKKATRQSYYPREKMKNKRNLKKPMCTCI